ncbi:MAG TPA: hypothetical protein VKA21_08945 [Candidatus Binatia bacterium]|nr:hypothetical protein [Candidatus Binatia bacterium]
MAKKVSAVLASLALIATMQPMAWGQDKCGGAKLKAAGKIAACELAVYAKAAAKNVAPDPTKLAKCSTKLMDAYTKAESGGDCVSEGDAGDIDSAASAFVDNILGNGVSSLHCHYVSGTCSGLCPKAYQTCQGPFSNFQLICFGGDDAGQPCTQVGQYNTECQCGVCKLINTNNKCKCVGGPPKD